MRGREAEPETPEGPVAQATPVYMIEAGAEGVRGVTPDYLDERANGGPEQFQVLTFEAGGKVINRTMRGRSVWDGYAQAALAVVMAQADLLPGPVDAAEIAKAAAAIADAMIAEKRRRDPQAMRVQAGSKLVQ
jgi:hypothetical protein